MHGTTLRRFVFHPVVASGTAAWLLLTPGCGSAGRTPSSIVVVTIDTLRADYVNARQMPSLDALGHEAVVFEQAVTVAPLTLPAHASLLTAAFPPDHGVRDNQGFALASGVSTFPTRLKERGYNTAAFVSAVVLDHRSGLNRGFDVYDDEIAGPERPAKDTIARAERWTDRARRPFFLWLHLFEPHAPYRTGSYQGEVRQVDEALAGFFTHLRARGLWNDLVLSVTADHGESLGEHDERTHGFFVYDSTLRIPWILKAPGLPTRRVPFLVRIVDEMPTALDLAGAAPEGGAKEPPTDGVSVRAFLEHDGSPNLEAYAETFLPRDQFGWSALTSIRTERWKFIHAPEPELYDLAHDPHEAENVFDSRRAEAARLERVLTAISKSPAAKARQSAPDPSLAERLMSLGYLGSLPSAPSTEGTGADPKAKLPVYNFVMSALELSEQGDVAGALDKLESAEQLDPRVAQVEFVKGNLLGRLGRYREAVAALERTVELDPAYTAARFKLALARLRIGRADLAAEGLTQLVQQDPDNFRAWHNLAAISYSRGDLDEAEALERKALAISPDYAEAWNTLGAIALVRKRFDQAIDALDRATRFDPRNAQAYANLALALRASGRQDEARAASQHACALDTSFCSTTGGR